MANITVTTGLGALKGMFNKVNEVYYVKTPNTSLSTLSKFDMEFPILSDGVSFDTGKATVTEVKLTTGEVWTSMSEKGEASISFQVPCIDGDIAEVLMNKEGSTITMTNDIEGYNFKGQGYNLEPKKVKGGLFLLAEDRATAIFLPNAELYASLVIDQSKGAYFDISVTPLASTTGETIIVLEGTASAA